MTGPPPGGPELHTPTPRPPRPASTWASSLLAPIAAGVATLCAATSLTGVVSGWSWLGYIFVAIVLVACTGLALRSLRAPTVLVGFAQLVVLAFLITGSFTTTGVLKIIPGPAAFSELREVLAASAQQIGTGLPPVDGTAPILCLVTIAIGLVAVLVDTLAVAASAPAATGLVLLCVYAVPASLSDTLLPWWTFVLGAASFAGLLAVDGNHRHRRWRNRDAPGLGGSPSSASTPVAVVAVALVLGLVTGIAVTGVGTVGSLPGGGGPGKGSGGGGFGVEPFTQLRGLLDQGATEELFKVRGLGDEKHLLRAFTLDTYLPNKGWVIGNGGRMPPGVQANRALPPAPGDNGTGPSREIQIQPTSWVDNWLPIFGQPRALSNVADNWLYDQGTGAVYTTSRQSAPAYTETASLHEPSAAELRAAEPKADATTAKYTEPEQIDPRVIAKAQQITENKTNNFDKATALWQFFTAQNGFTYDTQTAPATDSDALADFILNGKRGFCEQFASAMAVMLRAVGIPSRVAIGFTPGTPTGDYQTITSKDAHAWVEVYFGDSGWVTFDPTPLADGRGYIPSYLRPNGAPTSSNSVPDSGAPTNSRSSAPPTGVPAKPSSNLAGGPQASQADSTWQIWAGGLLGLLALVATVVAYFAYKRMRVSRGAASPRDANGPPGDVPRAAGHSGRAVTPPVMNWLPLVAAGLWTAAIVVLAAWLSWWFALVLLLIVGAVGAPAIVRDFSRRRRLQAIAGRTTGAADAAWHELMDECADRGLPIAASDTVRVAGQKLAQRHHLDEEGRNGLRAVIGVVEKSWYSEGAGEDPALAPAFDELRESLRRNAPMSWRGRLFPKSLLRRLRR
jgi:transglutaminase-like putative cysteine protease